VRIVVTKNSFGSNYGRLGEQYILHEAWLSSISHIRGNYGFSCNKVNVNLVESIRVVKARGDLGRSIEDGTNTNSR